MRPILVLACATLAFGLSAAPLRAQVEQPAPEAVPPAPPPAAEPLPPPPPFPPMPSSRPSRRWVDVGSPRPTGARHRARSSPHHATRTKHRSASHATKRAHGHSSKRSTRRAKPIHFSKKTIRSCHGMTYRQIMRHGSCRALMKQELSATSRHHGTRHQKAAAKHKRALHRAAVKRRRS